MGVRVDRAISAPIEFGRVGPIAVITQGVYWEGGGVGTSIRLRVPDYNCMPASNETPHLHSFEAESLAAMVALVARVYGR
jgi:hypothetical protein